MENPETRQKQKEEIRELKIVILREMQAASNMKKPSSRQNMVLCQQVSL